MKDAKGHGSNPRGGIAHQSGVYKITSLDRKFLTPLGLRTLTNVHPRRGAEPPAWALSPSEFSS